MTAIPSPTVGRLLVLAAAILWSLAGGFKSVLTHPTPLGLHEPQLKPLQVAFFRVLFAGLVLVPMLRRSDLSYRPLMLGMVATFTAMNALYISSMVLGTAAAAGLLQYSGLLWMYLAGVYLLGEPSDRRGLWTMLAGLAGVAVIVSGEWGGERLLPAVLAVGSGVTFAGVIVFLRALRGESARWLTVLNHLTAAVVLAPFALAGPMPTVGQVGWLALFGAVQLGLPYWLMAQGLRSVGPAEAGTISLIEPLLIPVWAMLVAADQETPPMTTLVGGAVILGALAWRYAPWRQVRTTR